METEFINEYISRLNANLQEILNKSIMLEAKLALANKASSTLQASLDEAEKKIADLEDKLSKKTKASSV